MHYLEAMADDDGSRGDRSRSAYVPTSPAMSSSPAADLPVVPLELRVPIAPPTLSAQGDLLPSGQVPSPFQPEFSPVMNVQNVDARQIHQQAVFVNEDRSAQVAQIAELRHQAILAEHGQQVAEEARHFRDVVENQAKVAVQESREQIEALANQRLSDMNQAHQNQNLQEQRAYLDRLSLERHTVVENERASAKQREDALRSELAEQSRIIKELRERFDNASGNRVPAPSVQPPGSHVSPALPPASLRTRLEKPGIEGGDEPHPSDADEEGGDKSKKDKKKKGKDKKKEKSPKRGRSRERRKKRSPSPSPSSPSSSGGSDDSNDSSSESSRLARIIRKELKKQQRKSKDKDHESKAKEADKILIPKFPTPEKYRDWKIKVRDNIAAASAKPDEARSWVGKVYKDSQTIDALDDSEGFATLDAKLLASLTNCAEGDLGRQIATFKELRAREDKNVKGRHLLLRFHEYFATSIKHGAIYGLEDLMSVKMVNDDLKGFINKWDSVLAGMKKEPENSVLEAYFHLAVKRFKPLEHDLALYDRAADGSKERTYDFLITAARAYLERKRLEKMRDATKRSLGSKDTTMPAPEEKKGICYEFQKTGKCKRGSSCPYKHEKGREKSKGKGKGKDRSQSRSRSLTPGSRKETCKFWKAGHCHRGKDCAFQHPEKTAPAKKEDKKKKKKKKDKKPRKRSSSRGSSGSENSTGSESQRRKGGKSSSSNAPAAVCLLRAVVMAAVVSQGSSVLITRPLGSVAMPVLSASNTMCTDFDNTENIDSFVTQRVRFDDQPNVFDHAVESSSNWRSVQPRSKKKRRPFIPGRPEHAEAVRVATEDASIAASHLQNAVRNELLSLPAECSYLCNSDIGCIKCFERRSCPTVPATEIAWIADTGSAHDLVSRHMLHSDEVSQSSKPVSLLTANGVFQANDQARVNVPMLGTDINPYVLEDSPAVVSVGQRCIDAGWSFHWPAYSRPYFKKPDGTKVKLEVEDYVPYLPSTTGVAMSAIGQPYGTNDRSKGLRPMIPLPASPAEEAIEVQDDEDNPIGEDPVEDDPEPVDERLVEKPLDPKRDRGERALKEEAQSIQHLLTHTPKNPFCQACSRAKMTKRPSYSKGGSTQVEADHFGQHLTADHLVIRDDEEMDIDGARVALVVKDVATDFRYVYPAARRSTRECIAAFKHFVRSTDDVGVFYSDNSPELIATAERLGWRHQTSFAYVSKTNAMAERSIRSVIDGTRVNLEQAGLHHQYWAHAARHACMANNIVDTREGSSPWSLRFGEKFKGPLVPFGLRIDYWIGPKNKAKSSLRFEPTSNPGIFLGYAVQSNFAWRKEFMVLPLKDVMESDFSAEIQPLRVHQIAVPDIGLHFPCKGRYNMIREGLYPGISISSNPPSIDDVKAANIEELVDQEVLKLAVDQEYEPDEPPELPNVLVDDAPIAARGSGDLADDPGGEEVETIEVLDPVTGETTLIPKTDSSYYDAGGYKARKYKGSSKPPSIPPFLWKAASKAERKKAIAEYELEEARKRLLAEKSKHKAAVAEIDGKLRNFKSGDIPSEAKMDATWEGVPLMPVEHEEKQHSHREKGVLYEPWLNALVARPVGQKEIRGAPDAQRSLDVEWVKLESKPAWLYDKVREWDEVSNEAVRSKAKVHVGNVFELCVEKGSELPKGNPLRKYKGRTVFQGNKVKDESDMVALFSELGSAPANMEAGKALDCYGSAPGNKITQGDGKQAYTQTTLKGKPTWIRIPKYRWPKAWHGKYKDPVIPLVLALYGHPDSGGFWERHCEDCLAKVGFKAVHPECWPSIFWHDKLFLLLAVYVDDFKMAGPASNHAEGWKLIGTHIDMDTPEDVGDTWAVIMLSRMASSCPLTITHSRMFSTTSSKILLVSQRLPHAEHRIIGLISLSMVPLCITTFSLGDALKSGLLALKGCSILEI